MGYDIGISLIDALEKLEAEEGIEPSNDGFANHCLTTWLLRHFDGLGSDRVMWKSSGVNTWIFVKIDCPLCG